MYAPPLVALLLAGSVWGSALACSVCAPAAPLVPGMARLAALADGWPATRAVSVSPPTRLDPSSELEPGKFLIASRRLHDPNFSETVVLLLEYGAEGALGLIINRPTDVELTSLLPEVHELRGREDPVYVGGPVSRDHLLLLVRAQQEPAEASQVLDDVFVTSSLDTLRRLLDAQSARAMFHAYAGYAGWAAGQLDNEVSRGDWHIATADSETVFDKESAGVWPELIRRTSGMWVKLRPRLARQ